MVICIVFAIYYFQLRKKYLQNLLNKEMDNAGNHQFELTVTGLTLKRGFTLKRVRDMTRTHNQFECY